MVKSGPRAGLLLPQNHLPLSGTLLCFLVNMLQISRNCRLFSGVALGKQQMALFQPHSINSNCFSILTNCVKSSSYSFIKQIALSQLKVDCCCPAGVCVREELIPAAMVSTFCVLAARGSPPVWPFPLSFSKTRDQTSRLVNHHRSCTDTPCVRRSLWQVRQKCPEEKRNTGGKQRKSARCIVSHWQEEL